MAEKRRAMAGSRRPSLSPCRREDGFTIIEVLVASVILLVGIMGVLGIVTQSDSVTASNRAREQGIALQREIIEGARSLPYDQLTQGQIVSKIQATAGLTDSQMLSTGWTYTRRNVKYAVAIGTCAVDDPTDGTGPHESAGYCINGTGQTSPTQCATYLGKSGSIAGAGIASGAAAADCGIDTNFDGTVDGLADTSGGPCTNCSGTDTNPNDYKRIVVLVRWNKGLGSRYALQSTTLPNPGLAAAPAVTTMSPASKAMGQGDQLINFSLTFNTPPATVAWYVDGTGKGLGTGSGLNWSFQWDLGTVDYGGPAPFAGEVLDGTYVVSAKGIDQYGQAGTAKASTVIVNRRVPYPPPNPDAGRNDGNAYIEWGLSSERDVEGYKVYRVQSGSDQLVCDLTRITRCRENGVPSGAQQYYVVAVDRDSNGALRNGDKSTYVTIPTTDQPPTAPSYPASLSAVKINTTTTKLSWLAQSDPDAGDSIQYYRIYRDGTDWIGDYYGRTTSGSDLSFTDTATNGDVHTYYVVAVDQSFTESRPWGNPVVK
jgi:prepilin-type N-terminal cleavage/methylation domain-containing protein